MRDPIRQIFPESNGDGRITFEVRLYGEDNNEGLVMILDRKSVYASDIKEAQETHAYAKICQFAIDCSLLTPLSRIRLVCIHTHAEYVSDNLVDAARKAGRKHRG